MTILRHSPKKKRGHFKRLIQSLRSLVIFPSLIRFSCNWEHLQTMALRNGDSEPVKGAFGWALVFKLQF